MPLMKATRLSHSYLSVLLTRSVTAMELTFEEGPMAGWPPIWN
jgi:hypothetical protein